MTGPSPSSWCFAEQQPHRTSDRADPIEAGSPSYREMSPRDASALAGFFMTCSTRL